MEFFLKNQKQGGLSGTREEENVKINFQNFTEKIQRDQKLISGQKGDKPRGFNF